MFYIGKIKIENKVVAAPMAGITDMPYRLLLKEFGAALLCTELVSAKAIHFKNENTKELTHIDDKEHPIALQLFGNDKDIMLEAAKEYEDRFDIIDINMGCPVPKVVNNNEGSALLKDIKLSHSIVSHLSKNLNIPVTVKIRIGFDDKHKNYLEFSKAMEDAGASCITVHGRTRKQMYAGECDLDAIRIIKENVKIPVIGNGNIFTIYDAKEMIDKTNCDAVALGRGIKGNPWFVRECIEYIENDKIIDRPTYEDIKETILKHIELEVKFRGEERAINELKHHICWYLKDMKGNKTVRTLINLAMSREKIEKIINEFLTSIQI